MKLKVLAGMTLGILLVLTLAPAYLTGRPPEAAPLPRTASHVGGDDRDTMGVQLLELKSEHSGSSAASAAKLQAVEDPSSWDRKVDALGQSLIAGLSTTLGAGIVMMTSSSPSPAQMAFALSLAGGVMVTVSLAELWLPKILEPGWRVEATFWSVLGGLVFFALSKLVPEPAYTTEADPELGGADDKEKDVSRKGKQWRLAMIMMLALTAHNFPEGLAVAVSSMESERLGLVVMSAIAVHNVPEGIAIAMPVFDATKSRMQAVQMATLSGLAEPLGALFALTIIPQEYLQGRGMDALLCLVGGIMTCVALVELFPEAKAQNEPLAAIAGTLTGVAVMLLTMSLV